MVGVENKSKMKENKNIERLFQEKFKDFEVSPPDFIWENIQEQLHPEEKKRRIIPFWFKTAGIAASFVVLVSLFFYNSSSQFNPAKINTSTVSTKETINIENNTSSKNKANAYKFEEKNQENLVKKNNVTPNSYPLVQSNETHKLNISENKLNLKNTDKILNKSNSNLQTKNFSTNITKSNSYVARNQKSTANTIELVANEKNKNQPLSSEINTVNPISSPTAITMLKDENKSISTTKVNPFTNGVTTISKPFVTAPSKLETENKSISNFKINPFSNNEPTFSTNNATAANKLNTENKSILNAKDNMFSDGVLNSLSSNFQDNKKNNKLNIDTKNTFSNATNLATIEIQKTDSLAATTRSMEENPMEKLLREKETKTVVDEKEKWSKWAVNSFVSPIFFNSFASGSPISDEFTSNEKSFNKSTSYGVGVAYYVNKRLAIRSGISNLNLDYDTKDIAFYSSFEDQSKIANTNIQRNQNGKYLVIRGEKEIPQTITESEILEVSQTLGNLNQSTQYIEVPVEMSYAILNKKITIALKGGMSTLFLTENKISINSEDGNTQIGKASNLNTIHFSSNVGLGLGYTFLKNFQFNVEPTLRYQLNTFTKNSENFSPYVIGVNTGISYKF